jgi:cytochrome c oxidase subunit II
VGSNGTPGVDERAAGFASATRPGKRRLLVGTGVVLGTLLLTGCSSATTEQWKRLGLPEGASDRTEAVRSLWIGAWIAALIVGVMVWALILYVVVRYRRRSEDAPKQVRYNLPLEVLYTLAPFAIIGVLFYYTVEHGNQVTAMSNSSQHTVNVVGQQWQWTFNYVDEPAVEAPNVYEGGTASYIPTLVLPVGETTEFQLRSPDVIHDFGVPGFLMKMDVIPGRENHYRITPTTIGDYRGKCYELCGVYHSRMLFNVKVVSAEDFDAYLQGLEDAGNTSEAPLIGGSNASTQQGLSDEEVPE